MDARRAKPVSITVPRKDAGGFVAFVGYQYKGGDQDLLTWQLRPEIKDLYVGRIGSHKVAEFTAFQVSYLGKVAANGSLERSLYVYGLVDTHRGQFFDGLRRRVYSDRQLAEVVAQYNGPAGTTTSWRLGSPGFKVMPIGAEVEFPSRLNHYLEPRTDWEQAFSSETRPPSQYKAGTTTHQTWNYTP